MKSSMPALWRGLFVLAVGAAAAINVNGQADRMTPDTFKGVEFRSIGPGLTTGRIQDVAIDPKNPSVWYVAAASGNLWKTENRGNTWTPIFDDYGSFSLGAVVVDPKDSNIVWVGTGENANQRSVSYGDGVYKSTDAGKTFKRMGLENSEHIQNIIVDPRNSNVVYVTAIGPLWASGGDRGVYKTTDGGATWKAILTVDADTGATDIVMDPKKPDVIYAAMLQRRRHVGQLVGGGPGSGLYKSIDGGAKWTKLTKGLPNVEMGRIGLGINWKTPTTVYALVTAQKNQGGFFRSDDAGATWTRIGRTVNEGGGRGGAQAAPGQGRGGTPATPPAPCGPITATPTASAPNGAPAIDEPESDEIEPAQQEGGQGPQGPPDDCYRGGDPGYYNEIMVDENDPETIWSPQTNMYVSRDGGKTWKTQPLPGVHVDHHDIIADRADKKHYIIGNDGGLYETYRRVPDVPSLHEPAALAVLSCRHRQCQAVLQRVRRRAGQRHDLRAVAHAESCRHPHERLVHGRRRRRLRPASGSRRREHRLRAVAGRRPAAPRPQHRPEREHPPEREQHDGRAGQP